ncbi:acyl-coenzyme A synthetase/AMP-(fatty) acid ligase [Saccharothrix tamanrassetensis]|uniref:Acyl-coenzyme A synthetase/AMP-(Fatty) acid ligase n=1 Tax=Saccharothrix tamanrassetensis TaxID=1051531 RepID=A0A841CRG9_9PSEU|nr:class I adenylate-forming enzyme family protein [Saccharothrix tamanrassetensis]MBB5958086.1 acyl-coenzyme A synthetase/AMP-(fatty) acid ligase [Saccharothrix tamanrassetensis]
MKPRDMGTLFDECAARRSHTTVVLDRPFDIAPERGTTFTVPQLADLVEEAAGWLHAAGAREGERVAVVKRNHYDYDLLACAAIRLGAVPALLSGHLADDALELLLKRLEPAVLVTDRPMAAHHARRVLSLSHGDGHGDGHRNGYGDRDGGGRLVLDDVRGSRAPSPWLRHDDDPLVINHTSGTTGLPKLVVHTTSTLASRLARFESTRVPVIGTRRDDVVANASSYAHGRTFCWTASVFGLEPRKIVILSEPGSARNVLGVHRPTTVEALPSTYVRWQQLAASSHNPFRSVRLYVSSYDAMHPPAVRAMLNASKRKHPLWMQGWGQTETGPLTFRFLTRKAARRETTARFLGRPVPGRTRLRVVDPATFEDVPRGTPGLVLARTKARCAGYVGEQDRWQAKNSGPWWNTGDLAVRTRTGGVRLLDREVDAVPGFSCLEVEDVVEDRLPEVLECVVLGPAGRLPIPVLVTADGRLDHERWWAVAAGLPDLGLPRVLKWDEVPRTGTGKVRRLELLTRLVGNAETHGTGRWT